MLPPLELIVEQRTARLALQLASTSCCGSRTGGWFLDLILNLQKYQRGSSVVDLIT